jgi:signal transduction histidine kinase
MTAQMERLTQLMASFVNVYRIQNGKVILKKKEFAMDELIREVISDYKYTSKAYTIQFTNNNRIMIHADRERIAQVLINLISNAIKYSPKADKVIVDLRKDTTMLEISVRDFGIGIAGEKQEKIFDRFYRVRSKKENNISGLGLGLYISSQIIDLHKGKIRVESEEGKGSTFYFSLPLK